MSTQTPDLTLYELRRCPYCAKVRRALDDLDLAYESRYVPGTRSRRDEVYEISGQYGVPVLVDEDNGVEGMPESDDIVEYLYEEYGNGQERPTGLVSRVLFTLF
jgi:glutaredoxin 3